MEHVHLLAERLGDVFLGAQVDMPLVAIDEDGVAVQRLAGDARGLDDQRDGERAGDDGGVAADRAFLEHHRAQRAAIVEQLARADVARHEDCVVGQLAAVALVAGEEAEQPVGEVVEVVQPLAEIGVGGARHAGTGGGLLLFHRDLGGEPAVDAGFHAPDPALVVGEHAVGVQDVAVFAAGVEVVGGQHLVDLGAQRLDAGAEPHTLALGVVADRLADHDLRLVQHHGALGDPLLAHEAAHVEWQLVQPRPFHGARADEGAEFGHLGDDHGHDLEGIDFVVAVVARLAVLHHEDAEDLAQALDRYAEEARQTLLAGLGQEAVAAGVRGVPGADRLGGFGDPPDQALADAQA